MGTHVIRQAVRRWARYPVAALFLAAGTLAGVVPGARAEFRVGAELPEFSLKAADGTPLALQRRQGRIAITTGTKELQPAVLVLHLFQPDCLQCQAELKALEKLHQDFGKQGLLVAGVAHRGDADAVRAVGERLKLTFPLVVGTGSPLARQFAAGDALAIADQRGVVRFAQVGYGEGDEKVWREAVERLLAGKPVARETVARARLRVGDRLPVIELEAVGSGKPMALTGADGRLTFRDEEGKVSHPKGAVGFFSRY